MPSGVSLVNFQLTLDRDRALGHVSWSRVLVTYLFLPASVFLLQMPNNEDLNKQLGL